jgi:hypothetical protein
VPPSQPATERDSAKSPHASNATKLFRKPGESGKATTLKFSKCSSPLQQILQFEVKSNES